jgi:hypothetical protein
LVNKMSPGLRLSPEIACSIFLRVSGAVPTNPATLGDAVQNGAKPFLARGAVQWNAGKLAVCKLEKGAAIDSANQSLLRLADQLGSVVIPEALK